MMASTWQPTDKTSLVDAVASVLAAGDPLGCTTDEIADALNLPIDGAALQRELEEMVARGILDRRGVGRGALYTLLAALPLTKASSSTSTGALSLKEPIARKAG